MADQFHHKRHPSRGGARRERALLRLVSGEGVVPTRGGTGHGVTTEKGGPSIADLLTRRGTLAEPEVRGVCARVARALDGVHARGVVHGDVKPANVVFAPDGDLWLVDFDAAGPTNTPRRRGTVQRLREIGRLTPADDVVNVAVMAVECATGVVIDPAARWDPTTLASMGCSADLAADVTSILRTTPSAARVSGILQRRDDRLPNPPPGRGANDPTPTVDIAPGTLAGLAPLGVSPSVEPDPAPRGWRRWASTTLG